jgi:hypothetical protein
MLTLLFVMYNVFYDFDIRNINLQAHNYYNCYINLLNFEINAIELMAFLILSAASIKSAQLGPHV